MKKLFNFEFLHHKFLNENHVGFPNYESEKFPDRYELTKS